MVVIHRIKWFSQKVLPDIQWDLEGGVGFGSFTSLGQSLYPQSKWELFFLGENIIFQGCLWNIKDKYLYFPLPHYFSQLSQHFLICSIISWIRTFEGEWLLWTLCPHLLQESHLEVDTPFSCCCHAVISRHLWQWNLLQEQAVIVVHLEICGKCPWRLNGHLYSLSSPGESSCSIFGQSMESHHCVLRETSERTS